MQELFEHLDNRLSQVQTDETTANNVVPKEDWNGCVRLHLALVFVIRESSKKKVTSLFLSLFNVISCIGINKDLKILKTKASTITS